GAHTPLRKADVLVFEHIPTNAGSTFRTVLSRWFGDTHVKHTNVFDPKPRLKRLQARFSDDPAIRALSTHIGYGLHERLPRDPHVKHTNVRDAQPRLKRVQARFSDAPPVRALSIHIGYGLHERLPGGLHYVHFTFLREPVDRTISHYYYALDKGKIEEGTSLI